MSPGFAGGRVRARRLDRGMAQAALAREVGISPSYLNLIEHGRRNLGGRLLADLARALACDADLLAEGAEAGLVDRLRRIAASAGRTDLDPARSDAFAQGFPGWARLLAEQDDRIAALDRTVAELTDRLGHDPALGAALHDILSVATAIRSTSAILTEDEAVAPHWRARFHRNLHEDSRRLADAARDLARSLGAGVAASQDAATPSGEMEAWLAARDFHVAELEGSASAAPERVAAALPRGAGRALLLRHLVRYAEDARALPLGAMRDALERYGPDPFALARVVEVDLPRLLRRLAGLPAEMVGGPVGLVVRDASGARTFSRAVPGFELPRSGTGCPLWPLHQSALAPHAPLAARLRQTGRSARPFRAWAATRLDQPAGYAGPLTAETTMLLVPDELLPNAAAAGEAPPAPVGVTCRICPLAGCPARRERSILPDPDAAARS